MTIVGWFLLLIVGISLGLVGSGGSILAVPILVYVLKIPPILATSYSLFVVGITSWFGVFYKIKERLIDFQVAFYFGISSIILMFFTRVMVIPKVPREVKIGDLFYSTDFLFMLLFGLITILAGFSMFFGRIEKSDFKISKRSSFDKLLLMIQGAFVGLISGIIGAGGGFLIIPGLLFFARLKVKTAMATSLFLVAINSTVGFLSDYHQFKSMDWQGMILLGSIAIIGVFLGVRLSNHIGGKWLKKVFAIFILIIAGSMILVELLS